jgi:hypothetical protein
MSEIKVVFFDIGDTLAVAHISPSGDLALKPLPDVPEVLEKLQDAHLRLGIISNTGEYNAQMMRAALEEAGLFAFFANNPRLLIYSFEVHLAGNLQLGCQEDSQQKRQVLVRGRGRRRAPLRD